MTESGINVRLAGPQDAQVVTHLADLVVEDQPAHSAGSGDLRAALRRHGGKFSVPYGVGRLLVAEMDGSVIGMIYGCPPVSWIQAHNEIGSGQRKLLGKAVAQIELLAVLPRAQGHGAGSLLIQEWEQEVRQDGAELSIVQVRQGEYGVMRWYRRRGYRILPQRTAFPVNLCGLVSAINDGGGGYQLGAKFLV